jgi:hypothetical protein
MMENVAYIYKRDLEMIKGEKDRIYCVLHVRKDGKLQDEPELEVRIKEAKPEEYKEVVDAAVDYFSKDYGIDFNKPPEVPEIQPAPNYSSLAKWRNKELGIPNGYINRAIREHLKKTYEENSKERKMKKLGC